MTFSRTILEWRSNAFTLANSFLLFRHDISTGVWFCTALCKTDSGPWLNSYSSNRCSSVSVSSFRGRPTNSLSNQLVHTPPQVPFLPTYAIVQEFYFYFYLTWTLPIHLTTRFLGVSTAERRVTSDVYINLSTSIQAQSNVLKTCLPGYLSGAYHQAPWVLFAVGV